jgi:hypothetical protein
MFIGKIKEKVLNPEGIVCFALHTIPSGFLEFTLANTCKHRFPSGMHGNKNLVVKLGVIHVCIENVG